MHRFTILAAIAVLTAIILTPAGAIRAQSPATTSDIPYQSVSEALNSLKAKPGVKFSTGDGWTLAEDTDGAQWSFTPPGHYANPSVGRRELRQQGGRFFVVTRILCEAPKQACDRLHKDYELLNQRMNEAIERNMQKKK